MFNPKQACKRCELFDLSICHLVVLNVDCFLIEITVIGYELFPGCHNDLDLVNLE